MSYNSLILQYLNLKGLNLDELSHKTQISLLILEDLQAGKVNQDDINLEDIKKIAEVLGCRVDDLFEFED